MLPEAKLAQKKRRGGLLPLAGRVGLPALLSLGYYLYIRPRLNEAGTQPGEAERKLPGDDLIPVTNFQTTRAIDIEAPVETVWMWLAQIGRDKSGYYGLDNLTNGGMPSVSYIRQDLPAPQIGNELDGGYRILDLKEGNCLIYGAFDLPTPTGQPMERTTALIVEKRITGTARLIIRTRGYAYGMLGRLYVLPFEIIDYLDTQAVLKNIKERAEMTQTLTTPVKTTVGAV